MLESAEAIAVRLLTRALDPALDPYVSPEKVAVSFVSGLDEAIRERADSDPPTAVFPMDRGYYEDHLAAYLGEVEAFVGRILDERTRTAGNA